MNKNQIVFVIGVGFAGLVGGLTTWYAGRKSYNQGLETGCMIAYELCGLKNDLENIADEKIKSLRKTES